MEWVMYFSCNASYIHVYETTKKIKHSMAETWQREGNIAPSFECNINCTGKAIVFTEPMSELEYLEIKGKSKHSRKCASPTKKKLRYRYTKSLLV